MKYILHYIFMLVYVAAAYAEVCHSTVLHYIQSSQIGGGGLILRAFELMIT